MRATPFIVALLLSAGSARAETAPATWDTGCIAADAVVPPSLPANVMGIPILGPSDMVTASLLAADGTVVPTNLVADGSNSILVPLEPLTVGQKYTLRWSDECAAYSTKTFVATASISLPSAAGAALVGPYNDSFYGKCDSLGRPVGIRSRSVQLAASDDMTPWLSIARVEVLVDGVPTSSYERWGHIAGSNLGSVNIYCPDGVSTHRVAVRVRLPNGPNFITPDVSVDLECPTTPKTPCETRPEDIEPVEGTESDAGSFATNDPAGNDTVIAGCGYGATASTGALWVPALALLALRRRRR